MNEEQLAEFKTLLLMAKEIEKHGTKLLLMAKEMEKNQSAASGNSNPTFPPTEPGKYDLTIKGVTVFEFDESSDYKSDPPKIVLLVEIFGLTLTVEDIRGQWQEIKELT